MQSKQLLPLVRRDRHPAPAPFAPALLDLRRESIGCLLRHGSTFSKTRRGSSAARQKPLSIHGTVGGSMSSVAGVCPAMTSSRSAGGFQAVERPETRRYI